MALPRLPLQSANPQNSFFVLGNPNRRIALGSLAHFIHNAVVKKSTNGLFFTAKQKRQAQDL